ncbi:MAG TPA: PAS domain-containing protein, partial [Povalibacter sp.]|nr:PAS domain-containing protein [Povalibacter sp.]
MMLAVVSAFGGMLTGALLVWLLLRRRRAGEESLPADERMQRMIERFNVAIEAAGFSAWEIDPRERRFVWVENRLRAIDSRDMTLEEYGDALHRMMHPEDRAEMLALATAAIEGDDSRYSYRYRLLRDGLVRHMQSHVRIVRDARGQAVRLVGATTDITNEVQTAELLLRQAEQERQLLDRLNIATQAAGISSWEIDLLGERFLWIENSLHGVTAESNVSLEEFRKRIHPEDRELFRDALKSADRNHQDRITYRYRLFDDDGRLVHVQMSARLVADESGNATRLLGVSWDVTREVEAAIRLKEQTEHERMLLDRLSMSTQAAGISSWEYDLDTQRFAWIENPIAALNGDSGVWGLTRSLIERIHPDDRESVLECLETAIRERHDRLSCRYRGLGAQQDAEVHVQTHARVLYDDDGHARRLLGISWDISKEIAGQQQLQLQALQLRDAERRLERASLSSSE